MLRVRLCSTYTKHTRHTQTKPFCYTLPSTVWPVNIHIYFLRVGNTLHDMLFVSSLLIVCIDQARSENRIRNWTAHRHTLDLIWVAFECVWEFPNSAHLWDKLWRTESFAMISKVQHQCKPSWFGLWASSAACPLHSISNCIHTRLNVVHANRTMCISYMM